MSAYPANGVLDRGNETATCGNSETEVQSRLSEVGHQAVIGGEAFGPTDEIRAR